MSLTLDSVSSPVVAGRCTGCGRFISRNESHFHSPPRKFRGRPKAHLFYDGGGCVTRCDDVDEARRLLIEEYRKTVDPYPGEAESLFAPWRGGGIVQRGRINVVAPGRDEVSWWWMKLDDSAKGPGVTTAVVWSP